MAILYPRLSPADAALLWESYGSLTVNELRARSDTSHPSQTFAAVGGRRIAERELAEFQRGIRQIAEHFGYPEKGSRNALSEFDAAVSIFFGERLDISEGEAYRVQTWAFISLVLLPDIVKWRFPGFSTPRCTGGRRDCFHRLWLRAKAFDLGAGKEDRWILLKSLTEDSFVSIMERPSLAGSSEICQVLGATWIETATSVGRNRMEDINRRAIKRVRAKATLIFLDALSYCELKSLVDSCYLAAVESLDEFAI